MLIDPSRWFRQIALTGLLTILHIFIWQASAWAEKDFATKAEFAILMDADTGSVLFEKKADELMAPASMSKLMTLAVIFKALKSGEIGLDDEFAVSENAWRTGGAPSGTSAMFAPLNTTVKLSDLIRGIIVQSGNDACIIVAEGLNGSEAAFAERMIKEAKELGLKKSSFRNSTGLPDPDHMMTARELAQLSRHIIQTYPEYYELFKQREFRYRKHRFFNRNPLISANIGVDGLKTGYTKDAGFGIVASALRNSQRLIAVVNGLKNKRERKSEARKLLNWGFRSFKHYVLFDSDETVGKAWVWGGSKHRLRLVGKGPVSVLLPRFKKPRIKASVVYQGPLKPPIKTGDQVAELKVVTANGATNWVPLYAGEDIEKGSFLVQGFDSLLYAAFGWIL